MSSRLSLWFKVLAALLLGVALVGMGTAAMPLVKNWWKPDGEQVKPASSAVAAVPTEADTLILSPETAAAVGVQTAPIRKADFARPLVMFGQFAPNTDRLFRVRPLFSGKVIDIAAAAVNSSYESRPLELGDKVQKGQLLAVLWSRDLGEKKSELVDNLSQLRLDEPLLERLRETYKSGAIPERSVLEQERRVEASRIAADRAERTLRSWGLSDAEIDALKVEAERIRQRGGIRDKEQYKNWARFEVRSPYQGTIVEKNANLDEYVDTTSLPLFQIADFSHLTVWAYPYEEDLPILQALPKPIQWTIRLKSDPKAEPMRGTIDLVLPIIEPNQRTPILKGRVDNPAGRLLSNQSVTATVELPASPEEIVIPTTALVEGGQGSIVFIQPDPKKNEFRLRRVAVLRRYHDVVHVRTILPPVKETTEMSQSLQPGELVVTSGAVLMKAQLDEDQSKKKTEN
jgi:cobalt-zinc-cadmium efflux system membrane fusion protein